MESNIWNVTELEIASNAKASDIIEQGKFCGVYFLLKDGKIVYIGQSTNVVSRIVQHRQLMKDFDEATWFRVDKAKLTFFEAMLIQKFKPKLNRERPVPRKSDNARKITRDSINELKARTREHAGYMWDSEIPGFGIRSNGKVASWVLRYRTRGGIQRKMTIGRMTVIDSDEARNRARKLLAIVHDGGDPFQDRKDKRDADLAQADRMIEDLRDWFIDNHSATLKGGKERGQGRNQEIHWRLHIIPRLAGRRVADITGADMHRIRRELAGKPIHCNRVFETLRKAFEFAEKPLGWRPRGSNPCEDIPDFPERRRQMILGPDDLQRLMARLDEVEAMEHAHRVVGTMVRVYLATGLRKSELSLLRWDHDGVHPHYHAGRRTIILPDDKGNTGREVGLPAAAVEALERLPRASAWVFPSTDPARPLRDPLHAFDRLIRRPLGLPRLRIHDLRHTLGSYAHASGASQRDVASMLGHRQMATAERYIGALDGRLVAAREQAADAIFGHSSPKAAAPEVPSLGASHSTSQR